MSFDYELIFEASQQTEWQSLPAQWMEDSGERLSYGVTLENTDMGTATWAVLASRVSLSEFAALATGLGLHDYGVRWRHQTFADIQSGYERYAMFIPQAVTGRVVVGGDSTGIVGTVVLFDISLGSDPHSGEHMQIVKDSLSLQMASSGTYGIAR
jgi:hypothetical protein